MIGARRLALVAGLVLATPAWAEEPDVALRALERENAVLRQKLEAARAELRDLRTERDQLQTLAALPPKETPAARLTGRFDPESRRTLVESSALVIPETLRGLDTEHLLAVRFGFAGEEPRDPIGEAAIVVTTLANTNGRYRALETLSFLADGAAVEFPIESYRVLRKMRSGLAGKNVRIDEEVLVTGDRDAFRTLALAQELRLEMGRRTLALSRDHHALIHAVYERMRETAAAPASR